jgi:hypothetical protein
LAVLPALEAFPIVRPEFVMPVRVPKAGPNTGVLGVGVAAGTLPKKLEKPPPPEKLN